MAVTIKDVAKLAGVSPSTVSRTCKNHPSISQQTKDRVKKAMEELGYMQNNLHTVTNIRNIGVVFPKLRNDAYENPFYLEALRGIGQYCNRKKYTMLVITGENDAELIESIKSSQADGFIFLYSNVDDMIINYMYEEQRLFVLIGKATKMINDTIYVDNDNVQAAKEATEYLISLGHKNICFIRGDRSDSYEFKQNAYEEIMKKMHNFREDYILNIGAGNSIETVELTAEKIVETLQAKKEITAIFSCNDLMGIGAVNGCHRLGIKVPEDISVMGFDNILLSNFIEPKLTTMDQNMMTLGWTAASLLMEKIANENKTSRQVVLQNTLVLRDTTAACRNV